MTSRGSIRATALGIGIGVALSLAPTPLNVLAAAIMFPVWMPRARDRWRRRIPSHFVGMSAALVTLVSAALLPVKQLDGRVGPLDYGETTLESLCASLRTDHRILVRPSAELADQIVLRFRTDVLLTRREVLRRLAAETGLDLRVGYCGDGSTILFGAYPCFTRLTKRDAQP